MIHKSNEGLEQDISEAWRLAHSDIPWVIWMLLNDMLELHWKDQITNLSVWKRHFIIYMYIIFHSMQILSTCFKTTFMFQEELGISDDEFDDIQSLFQVNTSELEKFKNFLWDSEHTPSHWRNYASFMCLFFSCTTMIRMEF